MSGQLEADRGFLAPADYGGFAFNRTFLRGFGNESALRNGFRDYGYLAPIDFANINGIEVLKGPASALYGNGKPGGDLNTVTSRIDGDPERSATASVNSYGFTRVQLNLGGRTGAHASDPAWRVDTAAQGGRSFRDVFHGERLFVAPGLALRLSDATQLLVEAEVFRRHSVWDPVVLPYPFLVGLPPERFLGEPYNHERTRGDTLRVGLTHALSPDIRLRQSVYLHRGLNEHEAAVYDTYGLSGADLIQPDGVTVSRVSERVVDRRRFAAVRSELYVQAHALGLDHTAAVGIELARFDYRFELAVAPLASINGLAPLYGALPGAYENVARQRYGTTTRVLYAGDRVRIREHWQAYVGVRVERFRTYLDDLQESVSSARTHTVTSPRLGVTYALTPKTTLFLSATNAARPQIGSRSATGQLFDEEADAQLEAGLQTSLIEGKLLATLSVFRMNRRNVLTTDPTSPNFLVASGKRRSSGVEFDLNGRSGPFNLNVSAAYTDARVTEDSVIPAGSRLPGVSKVFLSGYVSRKLPEPIDKWTVGAGLLHEGSAETTLPSNGLRLPARTTIDLAATYQGSPSWYAKLNAANVLDKRGYTSYGYELRPIPPRSAIAVLGVDF